MTTCGCGVEEGQFHQPGCDMERCPFCGGQLLSCECAQRFFYPTSRRDFSGSPNRFSEAQRAHAKSCTAPDWQCSTCQVIESKGTNGLPASVYFQGLHDDQEELWNRRLTEKGLVPFIVYPNLCCRCGVRWPEMFHVPDEEWDRYVEPAMRGKMLCLGCYNWIKRVIDDAKAQP